MTSLAELGLAPPAEIGDVSVTGVQSAASSDPLLRVMEEGQAYDIDALAAISGLDGVRLLPRLLDLELEGRVRRADGGRFMRAG